MRSKRLKRTTLTLLSAILAAGMLLTACSGSSQEEQKATPKQDTAQEETPRIVNPLTGVEKGFDASALKRRTVAIVVENTPDARPQWGMDDKKYAPDIILEGEVEGGITRTLWFYADYKKIPKKVGPMRSARPPFIRFSELFDSIFIHWGQSHSKGAYIGANTIFRRHKVQHINGMDFSNKCGLYDRDSTRNVSSEHTGIIHGNKVAAAIKEYGHRQKPKQKTVLYFNEKAVPAGDQKASKVALDYSARSNWETTVWNYDKKDQKYHTSNFDNDLERDNLLVLFDKTEYIEKQDYQGGGGGTVVYCDYKMKKGTGKYISQGKARDIGWKASWRKKELVLFNQDLTEDMQKAADATITGLSLGETTTIEAEPVPITLNQGKTWIGWASSNHGGKLKLS